MTQMPKVDPKLATERDSDPELTKSWSYPCSVFFIFLTVERIWIWRECLPKQEKKRYFNIYLKIPFTRDSV
jgi:hypothetical protein